MSLTYAYAADIVKAERNADGDLEVYGKAAGPELDIAYQICDPKWLKTAMPEWMTWGNVREQHSMLAAGVGTELTEDGASWLLRSTCVDPGTAQKIDKGVLKGYSVGIKNPKVVKDAAAPGGRIVGGTIVEVSYVDRPANATCTLTIAKAADGAPLGPVDAPEPETVTQAKGVLADLAELLPDLTKADDESSDIAGATDAVARIARLIQSEADGLADGQMNEAGDIRLLLDAVSALRWFMEREAAEPEPSEEDDMTDSLISLGVNADLVKAAGADTATDDDRAAVRADVLKALGLDGLADTIAAKVTDTVADQIKTGIEATKAAAAEERTRLADRLAKVEEMAAPGGPVRARTTEQAAKAAHADTKRQQAAYYRQVAGQVDRVTAEGYLAKAAQLDAELAAL